MENYVLFFVIGFFKKNLFFLNENHRGFHMRQRLFLHTGWFLQNLEKGFIRTNMHTTVPTYFQDYRYIVYTVLKNIIPLWLSKYEVKCPLSRGGIGGKVICHSPTFPPLIILIWRICHKKLLIISSLTSNSNFGHHSLLENDHQYFKEPRECKILRYTLVLGR